MNIQDMIRAWRDSTYREHLTEEQRALLPENPIGETLSEEELSFVSGGLGTNVVVPTGAKDCLSEELV